MKKYVIEKTLTAIENSYMYYNGHKEAYICKGSHTVAAKAFFKDPALWSEYLYTSKKRAERGMKIIQENTQEEYWDTSFRIMEIEVS